MEDNDEELKPPPTKGKRTCLKMVMNYFFTKG